VKTRRHLGRRAGALAALAGAVLALSSASALGSARVGIGAAPGTVAVPAGYTAMQGGWGVDSEDEGLYFGYRDRLLHYGHQAVVTSWGTFATGGTYQLKLKVGSSGIDWAVPRYESELQTVSGLGPREFPSRVRIFDSENIGVYAPTGAPGTVALYDEPAAEGASVVWHAGDLTLPESAALSRDWDQVGGNKTTPEPYRLNLTATIEPDRDGDGWGDETQDKCPTQMGEHEGCAQAPATPTKSKGKKHGKRRKCKKGFKAVKVKVKHKGKIVRGKNGKPKKKTVCKRVKKKGKGHKQRGKSKSHR
jgi:hypothetical protein